MDWVVFGDDWGAHPSTTQHLVKSLPATDRVIWIDSIGMRAPKLNASDAARAFKKLRGEPCAVKDAAKPCAAETPRLLRLRPRALPFHRTPPARAANRRLLSRLIRGAMDELAVTRPVLLSATPVAAAYLEALDSAAIGYLRLDDYARLPGVDPALIAEFEPMMFEHADLVVATAKGLLPPAPWTQKGRYLPQGVDWEHFAQVSLTPPGEKVLGFFGLMAEWLDHELIAAVAAARPDWRLEFIGAERCVHPSLRDRPNVALLGPRPFAELPQAIEGWSAAWIPFEVSPLTDAVNPLKLREYLAAGLPTMSTPMPEAKAMTGDTDLFCAADPQAVAAWLDRSLATDDAEARKRRRDSVMGDGWRSRAAELGRLFADAQAGRAASAPSGTGETLVEECV